MSNRRTSEMSANSVDGASLKRIRQIVDELLASRPHANRGLITMTVRNAKRIGPVTLTNSQIDAAIDRVLGEREAEAKAALEIVAKEHSIEKKLDLVRYFPVNEYLALGLDKQDQTSIIVNGSPFRICKHIIITLPINTEGDNIDELVDIARERRILEIDDHDDKIPSDVAFWAHCSNIQAWADHDYDTRLIDSRLSFPLLQALARAGDARARQAFAREIDTRLESGYYTTIVAICDSIPETLEPHHLVTILPHLDQACQDDLIDKGILETVSGEKHYHLDKAVFRGFLDLLAKTSDSTRSRFLIARNLITPSTTLELLARDPEPIVRRAVALNATTPRTIIAQIIASDPDQLVRRAASQRPRFDRPDMQPLPSDPSSDRIPYVSIRGTDEEYALTLEWASENAAGDHHRLIDTNEVEHVELNLSGLGITYLEDIEGLDTIPRIDVLNLSINELVTLDQIGNMPWAPGLRTLSVHSNKLEQIGDLSNFISLESLQLSKNKLVSIEGIQVLSNLSKLSLNFNQLVNLPDFEALSSLTEFNAESNKINNITPIEKLKNLEKLSLSGNPLVDINVLVQIPSLRMIFVHNIPDLKIPEKLLLRAEKKEISLYYGIWNG